MPFLHEDKNGLWLDIYVQPKASKSRLIGLHDKSLKICITAPPVDGKANTAVIAFLATIFHISKSSVSIISGQSGRRKKVHISHINEDAVRTLIQQSLDY